jgi:hypothetical protein
MVKHIQMAVSIPIPVPTLSYLRMLPILLSENTLRNLTRKVENRGAIQVWYDAPVGL